MKKDYNLTEAADMVNELTTYIGILEKINNDIVNGDYQGNRELAQTIMQDYIEKSKSYILVISESIETALREAI